MPFPWTQGQFTFRPAGLRDALLRAEYGGNQMRRSSEFPEGLMKTVKEWHEGIGCTPSEWATLLTLCNIPPCVDTRRKESRRRMYRRPMGNPNAKRSALASIDSCSFGMSE